MRKWIFIFAGFLTLSNAYTYQFEFSRMIGNFIGILIAVELIMYLYDMFTHKKIEE